MVAPDTSNARSARSGAVSNHICEHGLFTGVSCAVERGKAVRWSSPRMPLILLLAACGTPPSTPQPVDYHAQLDDLDLVGEHFGVELEEEPELEAFILEGLEMLAIWELDDAYWAEETVGESDTARAYNKAAGAVDRMVWEPDQDGMFRGHPDPTVTVGRWAHSTSHLHPLNATMNLLNLLEGREAAADAAEDAVDSEVFVDDEEARMLLTFYAMKLRER